MLTSLALLGGIGGFTYLAGKARSVRNGHCGNAKAKEHGVLIDALVHASQVDRQYIDTQSVETQQNGSAIPETLPAIFGSARRQQLEEFSGESTDSALIQAVHRDLKLSFGALGLSIAGRFLFPPLSLLSLVGLMAVYIPWFKDGYRSLVQERKVIELRPTIRPEAQQIINGIHQQNLSTAIISGDHEKPTAKLAGELGIKYYFAETLPEQKAALIQELQRTGKTVCFVGDGINDAIALKQADLSISLRGASSIATDAAQIVLMDGSLTQLARLFEIGHEFDTNVKQSLLMTLVPNAAAVGGLLFFHMGILAPLLLSYVGMGLGVANAMLPMARKR